MKEQKKEEGAKKKLGLKGGEEEEKYLRVKIKSNWAKESEKRG